MDALNLVPTPDTIPAPAWIFLLLDVLTFTLHILVINVVVGSSLIILITRLFKAEQPLENRLHNAAAGKLPVLFAIGINLGVAPLLFMQVLYGHLFYTSSVLMARYWIWVIPLLILAYYGAYIHIRKYNSPLLSKTALFITTLFLIYISFIYVNNMTLMAQPAKWIAYFNNKSGTILNLHDATLLPRYFHFITASIAVAGLFMGIVWYIRQKKGVAGADRQVITCLRIFAIATSVQILTGFWFLFAIPSDFILQFMGRNFLYTAVLFTGIVMAIGAIISGFLGKIIPTFIHLVVTMAVMVLTRMNLRSLYMDDFFHISSLEVKPQYSVLVTFLVIFVIGIGVVIYMLKMTAKAGTRRAS